MVYIEALVIVSLRGFGISRDHHDVRRAGEELEGETRTPSLVVHRVPLPHLVLADHMNG